MNKKIRNIIIGIVIIVVIVGVILMVKSNSSSKEKTIEGVEGTSLTDEVVQNKILTEVINDAVAEMDLGKNGEYRLKVQADNIINMLTNEILLEQSFLSEVEIESDTPVEVYLLTYSYDEPSANLEICVKGLLNDTEKKIVTYKLENGDSITYKKIDSRVE